MCDSRACITDVRTPAKCAWQTLHPSRPRHFRSWYLIVIHDISQTEPHNYRRTQLGEVLHLLRPPVAESFLLEFHKHHVPQHEGHLRPIVFEEVKSALPAVVRRGLFHLSNAKESGSGRFWDFISCTFCMSHDVCDACRSITDFPRSKNYIPFATHTYTNFFGIIQMQHHKLRSSRPRHFCIWYQRPGCMSKAPERDLAHVLEDLQLFPVRSTLLPVEVAVLGNLFEWLCIANMWSGSGKLSCKFGNHKRSFSCTAKHEKVFMTPARCALCMTKWVFPWQRSGAIAIR